MRVKMAVYKGIWRTKLTWLWLYIWINWTCERDWWLPAIANMAFRFSSFPGCSFSRGRENPCFGCMNKWEVCCVISVVRIGCLKGKGSVRGTKASMHALHNSCSALFGQFGRLCTYFSRWPLHWSCVRSWGAFYRNIAGYLLACALMSTCVVYCI